MTNESDSKNNEAGRSFDENNTTRRSASRRRLLKQMAGGGSAVVVTTAFTDRWYKPVVNSVVLPVHAQTSPVCTLNASALFASEDSDNTPAEAGPFSCGAGASIATGDADWFDISINGIEANVSPPGTVVSLDVTGDAVSAGNANQTSQTEDSDPTNGDVTFADINFPADTDPSGTNLVLTFSSASCDDCVIQLSFTDEEP